ncbi:peptidoglycan DD-metalloendopeptidase family protein [Nostoc sp. FACHB-973]|nr:peptidoglycan DD-metalloendopeptidase family protein [Nostoc sp. FACHB-973]
MGFSRDLLAPFVKITVGKLGDSGSDIFTVGDSKLIRASLSIGEGENLSNCTFTVLDPDRKLADKYFTYIETANGLDTVETISQTSDSSDLKTTQPTQDLTTPGKVIFNNVQASFYDGRGATGGGSLGAYGDRIDFNGYYAAMVDRKYKYAKVRVTNLANSKSVIVKVIDRGPFAIDSSGATIRPLQENATRKIDLTPRAFNSIASASAGIINVRIELIEGEVATKDTPTPKTANTTTQDVIPQARTLAGKQITIELGYNGQTITAESFIHTGLGYSLFAPNELEFSGQCAAIVLNQKVKNTAYSGVSLKKIAQRITKAYGMSLIMPEEGPKYEFFPQRGVTDYEALLTEARRCGYRVYSKGSTLYIQPRAIRLTQRDQFTLAYGENMGITLDINHQAGGDSTGGARASTPASNHTTGERKFQIDPNTGKLVQTRNENAIGTGKDGAIATTGSATVIPKPKTTGETDQIDATRRESELRIRGIKGSASFPATVESLLITPDTSLLLEGVSTFINRVWVVENVSHDYNLGSFQTSLTFYSPLKNKSPKADIQTTTATTTTTTSPVSQSSGYIIPTTGVYTSPFGMRWGRMHQGVDIANVTGTPIYASAAGTVSFAGTSGGYGLLIKISHPNGDETRYGHNSQLLVSSGGVVAQGQLIAKMGSTGHSTGPHCHFEIRVNGTPINPATKLKLPRVNGRV